MHFKPLAHFGQVPPPQSRSVSLPSFWWSVHWLATQVSDTASQALEAQSPLTLHFLLSAHFGQVPPPQSKSVSSPSCWWSVHWVATPVRAPASQALEAQSPSTRHLRPLAHAGHMPPPQSRSVSLPSFFSSVQVLDAHLPITLS